MRGLTRMARVWPAVLLGSMCFILTNGLPATAGSSSIGVAATKDHSAAAGSISPGTQITMQNWREYSEFMPDGMRALFEGKYFWKMPADVEMDVGPTVIHPLPKGYLEATEVGRSQTRVTTLPDGRRSIDGYRGGLPFPDPAETHIGWKILAD